MEPGQFIRFKKTKEIYYIAAADLDDQEESLYLEDLKDRQNNYWYTLEFLKAEAEVIKFSFIKRFILLILKKWYYKIY